MRKELEQQILDRAAEYHRAGRSDEAMLALLEPVMALGELRSIRFTISKHAVERYRTRTQQHQNDTSIINQIAQMLDAAKEVEVKEVYRVIQLLNHQMKDARYFKAGKWMFVVVENNVVTCYRDHAGRWK